MKTALLRLAALAAVLLAGGSAVAQQDYAEADRLSRCVNNQVRLDQLIAADRAAIARDPGVAWTPEQVEQARIAMVAARRISRAEGTEAALRAQYNAVVGPWRDMFDCGAVASTISYSRTCAEYLSNVMTININANADAQADRRERLRLIGESQNNLIALRCSGAATVPPEYATISRPAEVPSGPERTFTVVEADPTTPINPEQDRLARCTANRAELESLYDLRDGYPVQSWTDQELDAARTKMVATRQLLNTPTGDPYSRQEGYAILARSHRPAIRCPGVPDPSDILAKDVMRCLEHFLGEITYQVDDAVANTDKRHDRLQRMREHETNLVAMGCPPAPPRRGPAQETAEQVREFNWPGRWLDGPNNVYTAYGSLQSGLSFSYTHPTLPNRGTWSNCSSSGDTVHCDVTAQMGDEEKDVAYTGTVDLHIEGQHLSGQIHVAHATTTWRGPVRASSIRDGSTLIVTLRRP